MARMQISPEQLAKVKQTLNVAAPTGKPTMGAAGQTAKGVPHKPGMPGSGQAAQLGEVKITATPIKKEPEFGTFNFNNIYKVGNTGYDGKDMEIAHKKILSTYGEDSDENKAFLAMLGINPKDFSGGDWKKIMKPVKVYRDKNKDMIRLYLSYGHLTLTKAK